MDGAASNVAKTEKSTRSSTYFSSNSSFMNRVHQFIFALSVIGLCWLGMMVTHELGHVVAAVLSGGVIERVVLHPLSISRTDVSPNPNPLLVVWAGPIFGCTVPLLLNALIPKQLKTAGAIGAFFAGFCLISNGAYISIGSIEQIGDCKEMLRYGSPIVLLVFFGSVAATAGFVIWHRLGSLTEFISSADHFTYKESLSALAVFATVSTVLAMLPSP